MASTARLTSRCRFREIQPAVTGAATTTASCHARASTPSRPRARSRRTTRRATSTAPTATSRARRAGALVRVPVQLPERPEPDRGDRARGRAAATDPIPPRENRHGIPNLGRVHPLQPPDRGLGRRAPTTSSSTPATRRKGNGGPNGVGSKKDVGDPRRPRRRLRAAQHDRAPRGRARHLRARDRRLHARPLQGVLLSKPVRDAHLRRPTTASSRTARPSATATRASTRAARPRPACSGRPGTEVAVQPGDPRSATCTTTSRATRARTATPSTSATTTSTTTRSASRPTSSPAPGTPATRATRRCSRRTTSTRTTSTPTRRGSDVKPAFPFPVGTGLWIAGGNHHKVRGQPLLRQLAARHDAVLGARLARLRPGRRRQRAGRLRRRARSRRRTTTRRSTTTWASRPDGQGRPRTASTSGGTQFPGSRGNCWFRNTGPKPITTSPPGCCRTATTASDPATSVGTGNPRTSAS